MSNGKSDPKAIDLIKEKNADSKPFVSIEYFPPRTEVGVKNLYKRMDRMKAAIEPLFTDVTWGAGGSTAELSLELALYAHKNGHCSNMHLTCTNMEKDGDPKLAVKEALQSCKDGGIRNIVALRGDPPAGEEEWTAAEGGFTCALDLVKYIREHFGDYFGVSVAGYPEGHPNAISEIEDPSTMTETEKARSSSCDGKTYTCKDDDYKKEMDYLKEKIDAGADFIITQMFFDTKVFGTFVEDCKKWGINCPIVPGIMCINAYAGFCKMTKFCKTRVPAELQAKMDSIKDDKDAVKKFGVDFGIEMCQDLIKIGVDVLHFYTLNLEKVVYGICEGLGYEVKAEANESDAASMVAKGSAWARVGDVVKSIYGTGTVREIRKDGAAVIEIESWLMADGQKPVAYLQKEHFQKVFEETKTEVVKSIYGAGIMQEKRPDGCAVVEIESWLMADGQKPVAYLQKDNYVQVGDTVKTIFGTGTAREIRKDGAAKIEIESWLMAYGQKPVAYLQKNHYEKVL